MRITFEEGGRIVRICRTSQRFTHDAVRELTPVIERVLPANRRRSLGLLLDSRAAPLQGDDEAERTIAESTRLLLQGFARRAVLVATAVGKLQVGRFVRENGTETAIFDSEREAIAHLLASG